MTTADLICLDDGTKLKQEKKYRDFFACPKCKAEFVCCSICENKQDSLEYVEVSKGFDCDKCGRWFCFSCAVEYAEEGEKDWPVCKGGCAERE